MQKLSLEALAREQIDAAARTTNGTSARTVYGGHEHMLRQTLIGLVAGAAMAEHESPGEATLQVLSGRLQLVAGDDVWEGRAGDLLIVPPGRHRVDAVDNSAALLTVAKQLH